MATPVPDDLDDPSPRSLRTVPNWPGNTHAICHDHGEVNCLRCATEELPKYMRLQDVDIKATVNSLPDWLRGVLNMFRGGRMVLAGGFVRDCIIGAKPKDIDLFISGEEHYGKARLALRKKGPWINEEDEKLSDHALTFRSRNPEVPSVQLIFGWKFDNPVEIIDHFDFTVCQAVVWSTKEFEWQGMASVFFYPDLATRRLVYTRPPRTAADSSLLRILKFSRRGFRVPIDTLAMVVAGAVRYMPALEGVSRNTIEEQVLEIINRWYPDKEISAVTGPTVEEWARKNEERSNRSSMS